MLPAVGDIVRVRSRQYLVEDVVLPKADTDSPLVRMACLEDDAQGEPLEVLWDKEVDARELGEDRWDSIANTGFDEPELFSAYFHTLRWNCVTSTNPDLFQAPYRAGIEVKAYQLEPLRKALQMPRVNLFIADDVGLGKTIEAGLILRELLMRQKVRRTVICCPPSVVRQWQEEMEQRFGLSFRIFDRDYIARKRRERGYGINPWTTHTRFIISQALIRDETYAAPLRDWLGTRAGGTLLILDEAHNAAPASAARYALDSKLTRAVRDLARRFEHRLFLSATPHNGHSNSFAALLEILDPLRFCRGVPVKGPKLLEAVMVRRLKADLRQIGEKFPTRKTIRIEIGNLAENAPELALSRLLQEYREAKEQRLSEGGTSRAGMLVITNLQKRLLSSVEAFARTLKVHRDAMEGRATEALPAGDSSEEELQLLLEAPGSDDERAGLDEDDVAEEESLQIRIATAQSTPPGADLSQELGVLEKMTKIAEQARYERGVRLEYLIKWIHKHLCPNLGAPGAPWEPRRVLIFTEYADTKRYLQQELEAVVAETADGNERIATFHGGIGEERREEIKAAFNTDPRKHPLRILIATDAAREGVNLQNHCADLFHFDVPWNPSRMEQRNGRIDRKLQRCDEVRCHYFVLPQRAEDRVLDVLVAKTRTIHEELGSLSPVVEKRLKGLLRHGIHHDSVAEFTSTIEAVETDEPKVAVRTTVIQEELEALRERSDKLSGQLDRLRDLLSDSKAWTGLEDRHFRAALTASLQMVGVDGLTPVDAQKAVDDPDRARWEIPRLHEQKGADPTWAATLDTLRAPRKRKQKLWDWRREAPIRPVVFSDPGTLDGEVVHLHLEHRVVQRLLGRFLAQGFTSDGITRACVVETDGTKPYVIAFGRLSLYGTAAARLHDEVLAVAAEWKKPSNGKTRAPRLELLEGAAHAEVLRQLEDALARKRGVARAVKDQLRQHTAADVSELKAALDRAAKDAEREAAKALKERGVREAKQMRDLLKRQSKRIEERKKEIEEGQLVSKRGAREQRHFVLPFAELGADERRQLEADKKHWAQRLVDLQHELEDEPNRIRAGYEVKARRVDPVGLVYLWPVSS